MNVIIIRGLPGSGKSTLAEAITDPTPPGTWRVCEADSYFIGPDGRYVFRPEILPIAHIACQDAAEAALARGQSVIVANTGSRRWEVAPYRVLAERHGARVTVIDLFDAGLTDAELAQRCRHGVPEGAIARMRARWER